MTSLMRWLRRLVYWMHSRSRTDDLREELEFHQARVAEELGRRGLSAADAHVAARRAMGNETYMREEARSVWVPPPLEAVVQDWRYAWRGLRRSPGLTVVAVASLALGIGANAAIFSLIHSVLLARLPIPAATELIAAQRDLGARGVDDRFSLDEYRALASGPLHLTMVSSASAVLETDGVSASGWLDIVDGSYFNVVGVRAARGRVLSPRDDSTAAPVAVITDRFWRGYLNADSAALGRVLTIDGHAFTIVGITTPGFAGLHFPALDDVMIPFRSATALGIVRATNTQAPILTIVGRRGAHESMDDARNTLRVIWNHCCAAGQLVAASRGQSAERSTLAIEDASRGIPEIKIDLRGRYGRILLALMAGVAILLLAACANVASLLLARGSARVGELAVRLALGASRRRLVMHLAMESVQLSMLGAIAGVALARWATGVLARANIGDLGGVIAPTLGSSVLAFAIVVSLVSGLIFGVLPAMRVLRSDLVTPLSQSGRRAARAQRGLLDRGLIALQMALALLLVSGAMLLVETLRNLKDADLGFDPTQRILVTSETRHTAYEHQGMTARLANDVLARVRAVPGVKDAALASLIPISGGRSSYDNVTVRGAATSSEVETNFIGVTPGFFAALGIRFRAGHDVPAPRASFGVPRSRDVVVNEAFVKRFFPVGNPIGRLFEDSDEGDSLATQDRIVGVVADTKYTSLRAPAPATYYVPIADGDWPYLILVARPAGRADAVARTVARAVADAVPGLRVGGADLLSVSIDDALIRERISAALATLFGAVALALVAVGLYGVMLYQVTARTPELGIRMALGANARSIVGLVIRQSLSIVGVGVLAGFPLALLAGRAVSSQLYGVAPYSPSALAIAAGALVVVAIVATLVPVRRALRIDPLVALRAE